MYGKKAARGTKAAQISRSDSLHDKDNERDDDYRSNDSVSKHLILLVCARNAVSTRIANAPETLERSSTVTRIVNSLTLCYSCAMASNVPHIMAGDKKRNETNPDCRRIIDVCLPDKSRGHDG
jgi:hypothetical protein